eukprot:Gb_28478 [translate_table: standard]
MEDPSRGYKWEEAEILCRYLDSPFSREGLYQDPTLQMLLTPKKGNCIADLVSNFSGIVFRVILRELILRSSLQAVASPIRPTIFHTVWRVDRITHWTRKNLDHEDQGVQRLVPQTDIVKTPRELGRIKFEVVNLQNALLTLLCFGMVSMAFLCLIEYCKLSNASHFLHNPPISAGKFVYDVNVF